MTIFMRDLTRVVLATWMLLAAARLVGADPETDMPPPSLDDPTKYQVETEYPGIVFQVVKLKRIDPNRLLALIRICATDKTPPGGVFIGHMVAIPPGMKQKDAFALLSQSRGVSLFPTVMTDDLSKVQYPALAPLKRWGFLSPVLMGQYSKGRVDVCNLQFACPPPPPPPPPGQPAPVQTLSFAMPHAEGSITRVPIPLPAPPGAAGAAKN